MDEYVWRDVPSERVGTQVQICVFDGATEIICTIQPNGKWTIVARRPRA